jgi:photosystem II stability/assembly factor-like uncharacterized protein
MSCPVSLLRLTLSVALLFAVSAACAPPAGAGVGSWTALGPDGGSVHSLAVDPSKPNVVYAGTRYTGLYKSIDGGGTWALTGRGLALGEITAIVFDPQRSSTLYAMVDGTGVYRSTDAGRNWRVTSPQGRPFQQAGGLTLTIDPRRPRVLYAGTHRGVYRSTNGGAAWKQRSAGLPSGSWVRALAVDARTGTLYAGVVGHGIFRSDDQAATWKPAGTGLPEPLSAYALALDPAGSGTILAGTDKGIYRSTDRGRSWQSTAGTPEEIVFALAFQRGGRSYAGSASSGIFRSADGGATWQPALEGPPPASVLAIAAGPDAAYAGTSFGLEIEGVFRSLDAGATWEPSQHDLTAATVPAVEVDPSDSRTIYAATGVSGLYKSTDGGASWTLLELPPDIGAIQQIVVDPFLPSTVYVNVNSNGPLLRSDDGGETWRHVGQPPPQGFYTAADLATDGTPGSLWAAGGIGLFHSTDRGVTWQRVDLGTEYLVLSAVEVSPRDPGVIFVAGMSVIGDRPPRFESRIFRSTDGGRTWQRRDAGLPNQDIRALALDPEDAATLWATTHWGIYRSTDSGASWRLATAVPPDDGLFTDIAAAPGALYAARQAVRQQLDHDLSAVLYSTDGGVTWTPLRAGLGFRIPVALEIDPQDPDHLLLGSIGGSLLTWTWP